MRRLIAAVLVGSVIYGCGLYPDAPQGKTASSQKTDSAAAVPAVVSSTSEHPFYDLAVGLLQKGEIVAAVRALDEAIKQNPKDIQAYSLLGQTYLHANEFDRAIDTFHAAVSVDPENGEIYYMLAYANGLRGKRDLAIADAEKALKIFERERNEEKFKKTLALLHGLSQE